MSEYTSLEDVSMSPWLEELFNEAILWLDYLNDRGEIKRPSSQLMEKFGVNFDLVYLCYPDVIPTTDWAWDWISGPDYVVVPNEHSHV